MNRSAEQKEKQKASLITAVMTANNTGNKIAVQYEYKQNVDVSIVGKCAHEISRIE